MTVILPSLNFSLVTDNDDMIQINVKKMSDGSPAVIQSAQWEMFAPGTRTPVITKSGSDIIILPGAIKFLVQHTDTAPNGPPGLVSGLYPHEATIITTDGRIHTVTMQDADLSNGVVTLRNILTPPPS